MKQKLRSRRKKEKKKKVTTFEDQWELVNKNKALWACSRSGITDDEMLNSTKH
jgi:HSP90 family molecular chaperone